MKRCPTCNRTYTNDSLRFCLQDGTSLVLDSEATVVLEPQRPRPAPFTTGPQQASPTTTKTNRTGLTVAITAIVTIILLAVCGLGAYFFLKHRDDAERARANDNQASASPNSNSTNDGRPITGNRNNNNSARPPTGPASPVNTASPVDTSAITEQVKSTLNSWASAIRSRDLETHMNYYADTLDTYYMTRDVPASRVRADRERAFALYSDIDVQVSNIKVTPDPSGQRAYVTFDKTWTFEGRKSSSGSVQQAMWLEKQGGRWHITGEKDLRVYYVNH